MTLPRITVDAAPVQSRVAEAIRSAIFSGSFLPGDRLIEREICEQTGASRAAVREALRELEAEGLVERTAGKGVTIPRISRDQAHDIYEVRRVLESLAVRLFAERASHRQRSLLDHHLREFAEIVRSGQSDQFIAAKDAFYEVLIAGAHNDELAGVLSALHARITLLRSVTSSQPGRLDRSLDEMAELVHALKDGDVERAVRAVEVHIENAGAVAESAIESGLAQND